MRNKTPLEFDEIISDFGSHSGEYRELPIGGRVFIVFLGIAFAIGLLVVSRVGFLNVVRANFYDNRSLANINKNQAVPAHRGLIVDRYGTVIAKNAETFSVFLSVGEALKNTAELDATLAQVAEITQSEKADLVKAVEGADVEKTTTLALIRNIPSEIAIALKGANLAHIEIINDFRREYPDGKIFAHVIGYTGLSDTGNQIVGKTGLEKDYDSYLRGQDGISVLSRNAKGEVIDERIEQEGVSGATLHTTLDADLQKFFYERLQQAITELGVKAGVGLAIQPKTGEILSLFSIPSFDNNAFVPPGNNQVIQSLFTDNTRPLFNRVLTGVYNPASTIKPLVALAALREKVIDDVFGVYSPGYLDVPNPYNPDKPTRFLDWRPQGWVNVRSALARSSNVFFYEVGGGFDKVVGLGITRLREYWEKFGLGKSTGIDSSVEATGSLPSAEEKEKRTGQPWRIGDTYNVSIGQGDLLVTPLQLLRYIASIAENGKMYRPHLVSQVGDTEAPLLTVSPELQMDYSDWTFELTEVRAGMEQAVTKDYGTAYLLHYLPVSVAAKTGSAQINNNTKTNAFFVGYAPVEDPQIAILILVEDAKEGSLNTIPTARDVLRWYYEHRIAPPQDKAE